MHTKACYTPEDIRKLLRDLRVATQGLDEPMVTRLAISYGKDPFVILISCLMSLRARDAVTYGIALELFKHVRTPQQLIDLPDTQLKQILYPLGFYQRKASILKEVCYELIKLWHGRVPHTREELLSIKHVGLKTANLVLGEAFGVPAICVDTHVHRLANKWGLVHTKTPDETERALSKLIPQEHWIEINHLFVKAGQFLCPPTAKRCKFCPVPDRCCKK